MMPFFLSIPIATELLLYISIGVGIVVITVMILGITIIIIVMKYRKHSKANNSFPKRTGALTLASATANQYPLHPTHNNMTESQYESIDGVGIDVTNKSRLSTGRKIQEKSPQLPLHESDNDDPNYSAVKSLKSPRYIRKESYTSDCKDASQTQSVMMKCYEDIDDLRNKKYPIETLVCTEK